MSEQDKSLMARHGITCAPKMMYFYKQYRYESLADALRYAESETKRTQKNSPRAPAE
jgi:hypothetical protein